jgi:pyridoxal 5'-phosphate synthase pdxT subunit
LAPRRVGILALQGDVAEHASALERAGALPVEVKRPEQLASVDGLIIPGGESTTVIRLLDRAGLTEPVISRVRDGMPLWGTCMGMIVAARTVVGIDQPTLGVLDVAVRRNAFGRQNDSVEVALAIPALGPAPFPAIFIRAPWIERSGPGVEILAERDGHGVMVRQGNVLGTSFHPELTNDARVHRYFVSMLDARDDVGMNPSAA